MADSVTPKQLRDAVFAIVAAAEGKPLGVKAVRKLVEEKLGLKSRSLERRQNEIKEYMVAAMEEEEESSEDEVIVPVATRRKTIVEGDDASPASSSPPASGASSSPASAQGSSSSPAASAASRNAVEEDDFDDTDDYRRGRDRAGQTADLEGWLEKKADKGMIKRWSKRYFRYYKADACIAYFEGERNLVQRGEISLSGAFLMNKSTEKRYAFTITMKTMARVWYLAAKDEATRTQWMNIAKTHMQAYDLEPDMQMDSKRKKVFGLPLRYPPQIVQGFQDPDFTPLSSLEKPAEAPADASAAPAEAGEDADAEAAADAAADAAAAPAPAALPVDSVHLTLHGNKSAVVQEVRQIDFAQGAAWISNLPRTLRDSDQTVIFVPNDNSIRLVQHKLYVDDVTPDAFLLKFLGQKIEASVPNHKAFPAAVTFSGQVEFHRDSKLFALHNAQDNVVHFIEPSQPYSFNFAGSTPKLAEPAVAPPPLFVQPQLWLSAVKNDDDSPADAPVTGSLYYRVNEAFTWVGHYNIVLDPYDSSAELVGLATVENNSGKDFVNAQLLLITEPPEEEEKEESVLPIPIPVPSLLATGFGIPGLGAPVEKPEPQPLLYQYRLPVACLPNKQRSHVNLFRRRIPAQTFHLVTFDTPKYQTKPQIAEFYGASASSKVESVLRLINTSELNLFSGSVDILRQEGTGFGARLVHTADFPRSEPNDLITIPLAKAVGITATRKQTGYHFDSDKNFVIESFEITVSNGRQQKESIVVEESMHRWQTCEVTSSNPPHEKSDHPRLIKWTVALNQGETITIKYTVFYSTFILDD